MPWVLDPHSGGKKIPPDLFASLTKRLATYKKAQFPHAKSELKMRFKNQFCYLESEEDGKSFPLGRLRYFNPDRWSVAFFSYSNEKYQPCFLDTGNGFGSFEQALNACSLCLT